MYVQEFNLTLSFTAFVVSLLLLGYAWRRRHIQGAFWFAGLLLAVAWVMFWYVFEALIGADVNLYVAFSKLEYVGLTFIPLLWLGFALNFSGKERPLTPTTLIALSIVPLVTIALIFSNELHGWIYQQPRFVLIDGQPVYSPDYGIGFWVYVVYSYVIFLAGSVVLVRRALSQWRLYRAQATLVFVGTAMPWISNLLQIFDDLNPFPYLYLNAFFLGACMVCFAFALFRLRLLDVMPLAYDTILNNVPDGIIVVDMKDRILAVNAYVKPFLDKPEQDPIGQPISQVFARYSAQFESLRGVFEHTGRYPIDEVVVEVRISPLLDRKGQQRGRLLIWSDVTAEALVEKAQREEQVFAETIRDIGSTLNSTLDSHRVLSLIMESIGQLIQHTHANIMLVESDGFTTYISQQHNYVAETAARLNDMRFDYRQYPTLARAAQSPEPVIIPDTLLDTHWQVVAGLEDVRSFACAPIIVDGELVGFINVDGDTPGALKPEIARRLQILAQQAGIAIKNARLYEETRLRADELKRRVDSLTITEKVYKEIGFTVDAKMLLEIAFDAILRLTLAEGGYVALSRQGELEISQFYGNYTLDGLARILKKQTGVIRKAIAERQVQVTPRNGTPAQIALPLYARDGAESDTFYGLMVLETQQPERFTEDRIQLLRLITDQVAVALQNVRLVETVRQRAAELETLYARVSKLEQLKSDMIRIAAHDLKNPLTVVLNYLQLLIHENQLNTAEVYPLMLRSAERMLQIIHDFLSLDRIEMAAEQQTVEQFNLSDIVARAVAEFKERAEEKSQRLEVNLPGQACIVNGDPVQLYEAVSNFISNAVKYTPDGGQITVDLTAEKGVARLEVRDTGYGIPEDKHDRLFQPFSRARTRETRDIEGTGLGLHLTKNIVERQGGTVIFRSEYKKGSTFGFQIPLAQGETTG